MERVLCAVTMRDVCLGLMVAVMLVSFSVGCLAVKVGEDNGAPIDDPIEEPIIPYDGLQLWLMADKGVTENQSSALALWKDQSSQKNDAVIEIETAPKVVKNAFGFHSGIRFDETAFIRIPHSDGLNAGEGFTLFLVHRNTSGNRLAQKKSAHTGTGEDAWFVVATQGLAVSGVYRKGASLFPEGGTVYLQTSVFDASTGTIKTYSSGELRATLNDVCAQVPNEDDLYVGKRNYPGANELPWSGDLFELIIYNATLTEDSRVEVEQYLIDKYGL